MHKTIKTYDLNTVWRPVEKSLVMKLYTVCNEDRWIVQTDLKGGKVLRFLPHRITLVPLTHRIALASLHGFAWRGRHYHFHQSLFTLHRGSYECSHALMALPLRHAQSFIGHFQRMVKNRSRQMLGLLTENIPENNLLTLMFAIMCKNDEAKGYTK